jgi:hypothetical protein
MKHAGARAVVALVAAACAGSGCYRYQVMPLPEVQPGESVRARLSVAELARLDSLGLLGPGADRVVEGTYVGPDAEAVLLEVSALPPGSTAAPMRRRIPISPAGILEVEVREVDRLRTAGITLLVAGGLLAVLLASNDGSDPSDGDPPPIDEAFAPGTARFGWSIPLGLSGGR